MASLKSPRIVANSARRLGCERGPRGDVPAEMDPLCPGSEDTDDDAVCVGAGEGEPEDVPNRRRVDENSREGSLLVDVYLMHRTSAKSYVIIYLLTASFHSTTHRSIQGIKLITTNSLVKRAVACMSFSSSLSVFRA